VSIATSSHCSSTNRPSNEVRRIIKSAPGSLLLAAGAAGSLDLGIAQPGSRQILPIAVLQVLKEQNVDRHPIAPQILHDLLAARVDTTGDHYEVMIGIDGLRQVALEMTGERRVEVVALVMLCV